VLALLGAPTLDSLVGDMPLAATMASLLASPPQVRCVCVQGSFPQTRDRLTAMRAADVARPSRTPLALAGRR
jgi:hypothetical protein